MVDELEERRRQTRQKACNACTKAKRRCDLQHPACQRCLSRDIQCVYSSIRLHDHASHTHAAEESHTEGSTNNASGQLPEPVTTSDYSLTLHHETHESDRHFFKSTEYIAPYMVQFFLVPDSWTVTESTVEDRNRIQLSRFQLNDLVRQVQHWIKQWIEEGGNTFIHERLYHPYGSETSSGGRRKPTLDMPRCLQDAYMACATYFASTTKNRELVLRIIEERVAILLLEEGDPGDYEFGVSGNAEAERSSVRSPEETQGHEAVTPNNARGLSAQLSRVQALLFYQIIRLYDGDPQSRTMAESLIPVLVRWCGQMLNSALESSEYVLSNGPPIDADNRPNPEKKVESDWAAWILAESIRRTWLVARHIQCFYRLLSHRTALCPGGLMFTTRAGLWQADSAPEWAARCREKDVLFCLSLKSGRQLMRPGAVSPDDVDDFGKFVLRIMEREEAVNQWLS